MSGNECCQPLAYTVRHVIRIQGFGRDHAVRIIAHLACYIAHQWLNYRDLRPKDGLDVWESTAAAAN